LCPLGLLSCRSCGQSKEEKERYKEAVRKANKIFEEPNSMLSEQECFKSSEVLKDKCQPRESKDIKMDQNQLGEFQ